MESPTKFKGIEAFGIGQQQSEEEKKMKEEIRKRKELKEKSIEERLAEKEISQTEQEQLDRVFNLLCNGDQKYEQTKIAQGQSPTKRQKKNLQIHGGRYFEGQDIAYILKLLGMKLTKSEIDLMLWEVDEDLDKKVNYQEFINMYKRCILDEQGLEPKNLFHMNEYSITVEDTLQLLFVRVGKNRDNLDQEIEDIFGRDDFSHTGEEKRITFSEYLEKINKRAIEQRKQRQLEKSKFNSSICKQKEDK